MDVTSGSGNSNDRFVTFNSGNLIIDNNGGSSTAYQIRVPCGPSGCSYPGTAAVFNDGQWYSFTLVFSGTTTVLLYVNGAFYATINPSATYPLASSYNDLGISFLGGNGGCTSPCNWAGYMNDMRIYNAPLSAPAIAALYQSSVPNFEH
jgi:hypothetical protein